MVGLAVVAHALAVERDGQGDVKVHGPTVLLGEGIVAEVHARVVPEAPRGLIAGVVEVG